MPITAARLEPGEYAVQPWKNGRGETREIARDPAVPYGWRVAWATIPEAGPFSQFPGYERALVLLDGGPVTLVHDESTRTLLQPLEVHCFSGDAATRAELARPADDLNVFTMRGVARARVELMRAGPGQALSLALDAHEHFLFGTGGELEVDDPTGGSAPLMLDERHTIRISRTPEHRKTPIAARACREATAIWIAITLS